MTNDRVILLTSQTNTEICDANTLKTPQNHPNVTKFNTDDVISLIKLFLKFHQNQMTNDRYILIKSPKIRKYPKIRGAISPKTSENHPNVTKFSRDDVMSFIKLFLKFNQNQMTNDRDILIKSQKIRK